MKKEVKPGNIFVRVYNGFIIEKLKVINIKEFNKYTKEVLLEDMLHDRKQVKKKEHELNYYELLDTMEKHIIKKQIGCTCGANYTSNPNYHLPWCSLYKNK